MTSRTTLEQARAYAETLANRQPTERETASLHLMTDAALRELARRQLARRVDHDVDLASAALTLGGVL